MPGATAGHTPPYMLQFPEMCCTHDLFATENYSDLIQLPTHNTLLTPPHNATRVVKRSSMRGGGGGAWRDAVEEVEWEHEATSTDDWSTNEWGDAAWAHFTTQEQLDRVVMRKCAPE